MTVAVVDVASSAQLSNFLNCAHACVGSEEIVQKYPAPEKCNVKLMHLYK